MLLIYLRKIGFELLLLFMSIQHGAALGQMTTHQKNCGLRETLVGILVRLDDTLTMRTLDTIEDIATNQGVMDLLKIFQPRGLPLCKLDSRLLPLGYH